jgi:hypothetical protein
VTIPFVRCGTRVARDRNFTADREFLREVLGLCKRLKGMEMMDQREQPQSNPQPLLKRNDRYILGAVLLAAVVAGLVLYNTRKPNEPTNQFGLTSAPETAAVPGGKK